MCFTLISCALEGQNNSSISNQSAMRITRVCDAPSHVLSIYERTSQCVRRSQQTLHCTSTVIINIIFQGRVYGRPYILRHFHNQAWTLHRYWRITNSPSWKPRVRLSRQRRNWRLIRYSFGLFGTQSGHQKPRRSLTIFVRTVTRNTG